MSRKEKIKRYAAENNLDGVLITSYENRRYVTGFTGSNGYVVITQDTAVLITDSRYTEQAQNEALGFEVVTYNLDIFATLKKVLEESDMRTIGYEAKKLTDYEVRRFKDGIDALSWIPLDDYILNFRAIKDEDEAIKIKKAIDIADNSMIDLSKMIKPGMTEKDIAIELEYLMAKKGSEVSAFGTIVASGKRSSLPHGRPSDKKIEHGDMVVIDFGACYQGYMSDITRTLWVGDPDAKLVEIYNIVSEAQDAAIGSIKAGVKCGDVDRAHREVFLKYGVEKYSLRGLGHGIGLEIHELPRVVINSEEEIKEGMIFTVEPGIYIPDVGGVRIEDVVYVNQNGCEVLTKCPKMLHTI